MANEPLRHHIAIDYKKTLYQSEKRKKGRLSFVCRRVMVRSRVTYCISLPTVFGWFVFSQAAVTTVECCCMSSQSQRKEDEDD